MIGYFIALALLLIVLRYFLTHDKDFFTNYQISKIMATLKELSEKVDALQTALDAEQEQIKNAIDTLTATVEQLRQDVVDGGTSEERQAVADKIDAVIEDLKGTIADEPTGAEGAE